MISTIPPKCLLQPPKLKGTKNNAGKYQQTTNTKGGGNKQLLIHIDNWYYQNIPKAYNRTYQAIKIFNSIPTET